MISAISNASRNERGAAMVEFAIVLPLLLLLLFGIVEFGRAYNVKVQLTGAVREGARAASFGGDANAAVKGAAPGLNPPVADSHITVLETCGSGIVGNARVRVSYPVTTLTPLGPLIARFDSPEYPSGAITLTATGVMRCEL